MADETKPAIRTGIYRHEKTGKRYVVLGLARCATNGRDGWSVVYQSFMERDYFYRDFAEFTEPGRFTFIE